MTTHLALDPTATGATVFPVQPEWLTLSAALVDEVPVIADREDLLVSIAPGAGSGAPACFYPARALIEVDGVHLGVDPATINPADLSDRTRYATMWGLLTHECGHAKHTAWDVPANTPPAIAAAALLLEEPRMEAAQIRRRPDDRYWLRCSARNLILADFKNRPPMTRNDAADVYALLFARAPGGIIDYAELAPLLNVIESILDIDTLNKLCAVWEKALRTADDDGETMIELGRQWCEILGVEPNSDPKAAPDPSGGTGKPSRLAEAVNVVLNDVASNVSTEKAPEDPAAATAARKAREASALKEAKAAAQSVFDVPGGPRSGRTATAGTRPPTQAERTAARVLGRALDTGGVQEKAPVRTASATPPGRVRMRAVRTAEAQRAAGAIVTAEPFTRITRNPIPAPPLRIGVACDVSGSMKWARDYVASAAWILANASQYTRVSVDTASVIFGHRVRPLTRIGKPPSSVTEFYCNDNWEDIPTAIDALDGVLGLSRPGAARLLVIVSDGRLRAEPRRDGQKRLDRLRSSGCAVLWLTTGEDDKPLKGATVHVLTDPTTTAATIGHAATAALRNAAY
ncbi:hypothetical protein GCM10029964_090100 [Kibdelosporangium lantanae]